MPCNGRSCTGVCGHTQDKADAGAATTAAKPKKASPQKKKDKSSDDGGGGDGGGSDTEPEFAKLSIERAGSKSKKTEDPLSEIHHGKLPRAAANGESAVDHEHGRSSRFQVVAKVPPPGLGVPGGHMARGLARHSLVLIGAVFARPRPLA